MDSKEGIDFAMLFTLRESRRTSDPVLSRDRGSLAYYNFTLDALALKPSDFCNVKVKANFKWFEILLIQIREI